MAQPMGSFARALAAAAAAAVAKAHARTASEAALRLAAGTCSSVSAHVPGASPGHTVVHARRASPLAAFSAAALVLRGIRRPLSACVSVRVFGASRALNSQQGSHPCTPLLGNPGASVRGACWIMWRSGVCCLRSALWLISARFVCPGALQKQRAAGPLFENLGTGCMHGCSPGRALFVTW